MKYVDGGYAIGLFVLGTYSLSLFVRRRRLLRAVRLIDEKTESSPTSPVA